MQGSPDQVAQSQVETYHFFQVPVAFLRRACYLATSASAPLRKTQFAQAFAQLLRVCRLAGVAAPHPLSAFYRHKCTIYHRGESLPYESERFECREQ